MSRPNCLAQKPKDIPDLAPSNYVLFPTGRMGFRNTVQGVQKQQLLLVKGTFLLISQKTDGMTTSIKWFQRMQQSTNTMGEYSENTSHNPVSITSLQKLQF